MSTLKRHSSFDAKDGNGVLYVIVVSVEMIPSPDRANPQRQVVNRIELKTAQGLEVNRIGKGKYVVLGDLGDIEVTSNDSNEPPEDFFN